MQLVQCEGAPRDLGLDQGRACARPLREAWSRRGPTAQLRDWLPRTQPPWLRDLRRHFPHQFESLEGIARGAGIPLDAAARELLDGLSTETRPATAAFSGEPALLARSLPPEPVLRRSRPEGCLRSIEITAPALPSALLGVNEAGLAVAAASGELQPGGCAAPGALLAQDCLERFGSIDAALEWCLSRPAAGRAALVLADAQGEVAGVEIGDDSRSVLRAVDAVLGAGALRGSESELAKLRREPAARDAVATNRLLAGILPDVSRFASADPAGRRLRIPGAWLELDAEG